MSFLLNGRLEGIDIACSITIFRFFTLVTEVLTTCLIKTTNTDTLIGDICCSGSTQVAE
jgi:hypothetical protein